ncbi:MAG TPA: EndoU domain-containing protein [Acidimicrobiales bacterium]|nr:EndoU domain-containing protein [Acidimicrobiales bacterium]
MRLRKADHEREPERGARIEIPAVRTHEPAHGAVVAMQESAGNAATAHLASSPALTKLAAAPRGALQRMVVAIQRARVSNQRRRHILDGDATGGGHRHGSGNGKSEFPATWSDDKIVRAIEAVSVSGRSTPSYGGKTKVVGTYEGVSIRVIVKRGAVVTAFPANN